jgi:hypothetical protein
MRDRGWSGCLLAERREILRDITSRLDIKNFSLNTLKSYAWLEHVALSINTTAVHFEKLKDSLRLLLNLRSSSCPQMPAHGIGKVVEGSSGSLFRFISIQSTIFRDVTHRSLVGVQWRFGGTYCLHFSVNRESLDHFSILWMETVRASETSLLFYRISRRHNLEDTG